MKTKLSLCLMIALVAAGGYVAAEGSSWFQNFTPRYRAPSATDVMTHIVVPPTKKQDPIDRSVDKALAKGMGAICDQIYSTEDLILVPSDGVHTITEGGPFIVQDEMHDGSSCPLPCLNMPAVNGSTINAKMGDPINLKLLLKSQNFGPDTYKQLSPIFELRDESNIGAGVAINGKVPFPRHIWHSEIKGPLTLPPEWRIYKDSLTGDSILGGTLSYDADVTGAAFQSLYENVTEEYVPILVKFGACSKIGIDQMLKFSIKH